MKTLQQHISEKLIINKNFEKVQDTNLDIDMLYLWRNVCLHCLKVEATDSAMLAALTYPAYDCDAKNDIILNKPKIYNFGKTLLEYSKDVVYLIHFENGGNVNNESQKTMREIIDDILNKIDAYNIEWNTIIKNYNGYELKYVKLESFIFVYDGNGKTVERYFITFKR